MKRSRIILLAFAAVLCMSAVAAASAMAEEPLTITNSSGGTATTTFTGTGGTTVLTTVGAATITCTALTATGTIEANAGLSNYVFTGCKANTGSSCKTASPAKAGEILAKLTIKPVWKTSEKSSLLLLLSILKAQYSEEFIAITCGEVAVKVKGTFLVPVGATQELSSKTGYTFTASQSKGIQNPIEYYTGEKLVKNTLEANFAGAGYVQAAEEGKEELTFAESVKFG